MQSRWMINVAVMLFCFETQTYAIDLMPLQRQVAKFSICRNLFRNQNNLGGTPGFYSLLDEFRELRIQQRPSQEAERRLETFLSLYQVTPKYLATQYAGAISALQNGDERAVLDLLTIQLNTGVMRSVIVSNRTMLSDLGPEAVVWTLVDDLARDDSIALRQLRDATVFFRSKAFNGVQVSAEAAAYLALLPFRYKRTAAFVAKIFMDFQGAHPFDDLTAAVLAEVVFKRHSGESDLQLNDRTASTEVVREVQEIRLQTRHFSSLAYGQHDLELARVLLFSTEFKIATYPFLVALDQRRIAENPGRILTAVAIREKFNLVSNDTGDFVPFHDLLVPRSQ